MGVPREAFDIDIGTAALAHGVVPFTVGTVRPKRIERASAGSWSVVIECDFYVELPDGRQVYVRKKLRTRSTEQRGRKPR